MLDFQSLLCRVWNMERTITLKLLKKITSKGEILFSYEVLIGEEDFITQDIEHARPRYLSCGRKGE